MTPDVIADARNGLLINGRSTTAASTFPVTDPATGQTLADVANGTTQHATDAVTAATDALQGWAATPPRQRADILRCAFDLMIADTERFVALISAENGKPQSDARAEVLYAAEFFRWFSEETVRTDGAYGLSPSGAATTIVTHRPVGVAALITPWNFPAAMATRKLAPALAAGCSVVLKPASETPLTALAIARLLTAAGVPDGVVNVIPTKDPRGVVGAWLADPRVRALSFTGSTDVGKGLLAQAASRVVNTSMELGGNAPFVVAADADLEAAVAGAMIAKFRGSGQACTAANRFYVHSDVAEQFIASFGAATQALRVGPASDTSSQIGPLINSGAACEVRQLVADAVADGASIAYQAPLPSSGDNYVAPTVLTGVRPDARILQREIFGPIAPIVIFDDETTLREWLGDSEYGLAAYVYSADLTTALRIAEATEAGMVGINRGIVSDPSAPFGGTKQSGLGREGAREGIHEFQETHYYSVDVPSGCRR